jgi:Ca2+-binding EF-hand superfamily protein
MAAEGLDSRRYARLSSSDSASPKRCVQFEALWNYITVSVSNGTPSCLTFPVLQQWRQMFESFDVDRNGQIDADELGRALAHYEYVQPL